MNEVLAKLSSYHLFNTLVPGAIYCLISAKLGQPITPENDLFTGIIGYYLVGICISRIGSLVIDPMLNGLGVLARPPYENFIAASKLDAKIDVLVETANTYRGILAAFVCLLISIPAQTVRKVFPASMVADHLLLLFLGAVLFSLSYIKQYRYVTKRTLAALQALANAQSEPDHRS